MSEISFPVPGIEALVYRIRHGILDFDGKMSFFFPEAILEGRPYQPRGAHLFPGLSSKVRSHWPRLVYETIFNTMATGQASIFANDFLIRDQVKKESLACLAKKATGKGPDLNNAGVRCRESVTGKTTKMAFVSSCQLLMTMAPGHDLASHLASGICQQTKARFPGHFSRSRAQ